MPIPPQHTAHVLEEREGPQPRNLFDDDEWIRSLTEAQEISTDIPEENVTYDQ